MEHCLFDLTPDEASNTLAILNRLANAQHGECYCRTHDGDCPGGDCDGCPDCQTGRARSVLVSIEDRREPGQEAKMGSQDDD